MIIWLASYPRSGNTMLRMILKSVFRKETYSKYDDLGDIGGDSKMAELVGHKMLGDRWDNAYQRMKETDEIFFVKTHDPPEDESKAIYIVRDGRATVVSYWHYQKEIAAKVHTLTDVIAGFVNFGSWGGHLDAWDPFNRPDTLFLRYETLLKNPEEEVEKISEFIGFRASVTWKNDFRTFHKVNPRFFRQGSVSKGIEEMQGDDLRFFWLLNGDWMEAVGYAKDEEVGCPHRSIRDLTQNMYQKLAEELNLVKAERDALVNSLSWKITSPMRALGKVFMRTKGRNRAF